MDHVGWTEIVAAALLWACGTAALAERGGPLAALLVWMAAAATLLVPSAVPFVLGAAGLVHAGEGASRSNAAAAACVAAGVGVVLSLTGTWVPVWLPAPLLLLTISVIEVNDDEYAQAPRA